MFGTILISICTLMHVYVFWRISSLAFINSLSQRNIIIFSGFILWTLLVLGRTMGHGRTGFLAESLEFLGMTWLGMLFLIFICLISADIITLFGLIMPKKSAYLRAIALLIGLILSGIAIFQGMRPPVIEKHEVILKGLPDNLDGTVIIALSDMHLGSILGKDWLNDRIVQVNKEKPDMVVLLGDIFEGHGQPEKSLIEPFRKISAPFGVFAVKGNHEFMSEGEISLFKEPSLHLLLNSWIEAKPGLVVSGIEDLTTKERMKKNGDPLSKAISGKPEGASILLSHTPWQVEKASKAGIGLMLSGHTHAGQIWPFGYLVKRRYPFFEGRYKVDGMTLMVSRGTGTWGPRMRLWKPGEILRITLKKSSRN